MSRPRTLNLRIEQAKQLALLQWLQQNPSTTIDELIKLRKDYGSLLGSVTVGDLNRSALAPARGRARGAQARTAKPVAGGNQRQSAAARRAEVLAQLKRAGDWSAPRQILAATGLDPITLRRSLKVLESSGQARRKGKARGTKWRAT